MPEDVLLVEDADIHVEFTKLAFENAGTEASLQVARDGESALKMLDAAGDRPPHLILLDLTPKGIGGKPAAKALDRAGLETNYNTVPFDTRKPFDPSGIRIGTPSVTSRGMREAEMRQIGAWMDEVVTALSKGDAEDVIARVHHEVSELTAQFPAPGL